jgi:hypothetical protein
LNVEEPNVPGRWTYSVCAVARGEFFGEHISFVSSSTDFARKSHLLKKKKDEEDIHTLNIGKRRELDISILNRERKKST